MNANLLLVMVTFVGTCSVTFADTWALTDAQVITLMQQYAPMIYMHPDEQFFPSSLEFFARNMKIVCNGTTVADDAYVDLTINGHVYSNTSNCSMETKLPMATWQTVLPFFNGEPPQNGVTVAKSAVNYYTTSVNGIYYYDLQINLVYPYNAGKDQCYCIGWKTSWCWGGTAPIDYHISDFEKVTIRFNTDLQPLYAGLAYHQWCAVYNWADLNFFKDPTEPSQQHPIFYSAQGGHGTWNDPGSHVYQHLATQWDLTDDCGAGVMWKTWKQFDVVHEADPLIAFPGRWGQGQEGETACELYENMCPIANSLMSCERLGIPNDLYQLDTGKYIFGGSFESNEPDIDNFMSNNACGLDC